MRSFGKTRIACFSYLSSQDSLNSPTLYQQAIRWCVSYCTQYGYKTIGKNENADDITAYVEKCSTDSELLRLFFKNEFLNPVKYFEEKGDGIFLWVELVIRQLAKAKSMSAFKKALEGFSDASGSMDKLYTGVLSRIQEDDWRWIREIIRWLVVAERQVSEQELKDAVEWCLQDGLADFHDFL